MATLLDAIERLPGNIVGPLLRSGVVRTLAGRYSPRRATKTPCVDACEARGMAVEFNTRFLYRDHSEDEKATLLGGTPAAARKM